MRQLRAKPYNHAPSFRTIGHNPDPYFPLAASSTSTRVDLVGHHMFQPAVVARGTFETVLSIFPRFAFASVPRQTNLLVSSRVDKSPSHAVGTLWSQADCVMLLTITLLKEPHGNRLDPSHPSDSALTPRAKNRPPFLGVSAGRGT